LADGALRKRDTQVALLADSFIDRPFLRRQS
jgi:hypothetical protein